ncbi:MAG: hypothetical protein IJV06_11605 [Bacteroidaceae bacterium]|nr:hypothetical protein [Bacteroidaceae bacterium]
MKVDATALFVKTMYVVSKNNADVFKNNAVASTLFAEVRNLGWKWGKFLCGAGMGFVWSGGGLGME